VTTIDANGCTAVSAPFQPANIASATISLPTDVTAAPGERVSVPLKLEQSAFLDLAGAHDFTATITFDGSMLIPMGSTGPGAFSGGNRVVTINGTRPDGGDGVIAQLDLLAVVGGAETTPLAITSFQWNDGAAQVTTVDGSFRVTDICVEGGARLIRTAGGVTLKQNRPNPARTLTEIEYEVIEEGPTQLFITDLLGRLVLTLVDGTLTPGGHTARFDAAALVSGSYFYVLQTPTERLVRAMRVE
jgi:hypothetical protein